MPKHRHRHVELDASVHRNDGTWELVCQDCGAYKVVNHQGRTVIGWMPSQWCDTVAKTNPTNSRK